MVTLGGAQECRWNAPAAKMVNLIMYQAKSGSNHQSNNYWKHTHFLLPALEDSQFLAKPPVRLFESKSVPANEIILKFGDTVVYTITERLATWAIQLECISNNTKRWSCL